MSNTVITRYFDKEKAWEIDDPNADQYTRDSVAEWVQLLTESVSRDLYASLANETRLLRDIWDDLTKACNISTREHNMVARALKRYHVTYKRTNKGFEHIDFGMITLSEFIRLLREDRLEIRGMGSRTRSILLARLTGSDRPDATTE